MKDGKKSDWRTADTGKIDKSAQSASGDRSRTTGASDSPVGKKPLHTANSAMKDRSEKVDRSSKRRDDDELDAE